MSKLIFIDMARGWHFVTIGLRIGSLPFDIKPLFESMLTSNILKPKRTNIIGIGEQTIT